MGRSHLRTGDANPGSNYFPVLCSRRGIQRWITVSEGYSDRGRGRLIPGDPVSIDVEVAEFWTLTNADYDYRDGGYAGQVANVVENTCLAVQSRWGLNRDRHRRSPSCVLVWRSGVGGSLDCQS